MASERLLSKDIEAIKQREKSILKSFLRLLSTSQHFLFVCLIIIVIYNILFWICITHRNRHILKSSKTKDISSYTSKKPLPNFKYILLWSKIHQAPFNYFEIGRKSFSKLGCRYTNCYVTNDREFFPNITKFDAIAFNGNKAIRRTHEIQLPTTRSTHQKYIYYNTESSRNERVCQSYFDNYFNWTATYRLKSDLVLSYIQTLDAGNYVVAPKLMPEWINFDKMTQKDPNLMDNIGSKSRAAAWFVSNCHSYSKREVYVELLIEELAVYNMTVDVYGVCGKLRCPRNIHSVCMEKVKKEYYFYLAFENDFDEDYVTEKVVTALDHYTVPIVYGQAAYERFLPPHSYIDASVLKEEELAAIIVNLIKSPELYMDYFRWRMYYHFRLSLAETVVCSLCEALNDKNKMAYSSYPNLRDWWNPKYRSYCLPRLLKESTPKYSGNKSEFGKVYSQEEEQPADNVE